MAVDPPVTRPQDTVSDQDMAQWLAARRVRVSGWTLDSIVGTGAVARARRELAALIERLRRPADIASLGAAAPRGVLLWGPPGVGKTHFARVLASSAGVPFYELSGAELTPASVRALGKHLHRLAAQEPVAVFIDEIDTWARDRNDFRAKGENAAVLLAMLSVMDGLTDSGQHVLWIAATNQAPKDLDPAILRPGRLGTLAINLGLPRYPDRLALLKHLATQRSIVGEIDLDRLAALTRGESQAGLIALFDDAAGLALLDGSPGVAERHLTDALRRGGEVRPEAKLSPADRWRAAVHEAGHVVAAVEYLGADDLLAVRIRQHDGGATSAGRRLDMHNEEDDEQPVDVRRDRGSIDPMADPVIAMSGLAAERLVLGNATDGGADDIATAASAIWSLAKEGRDPAWGYAQPSPIYRAFDQLGPRALDEIYALIRQRTHEAMARAERLVAERRDAIERFAHLLNEAGELAGDPLTTALRDSGVVAAEAAG